MGIWWHWSFWVIVMPMFLLSIWAQFRVQRAFGKYSRVKSQSGFTGAEAARRLLQSFGLYRISQGDPGSVEKLKAVRIEQGSGMLTDFYNPASKVLKLSEKVYNGTSLAALGVAAHEAGHAIQHAIGYVPLVIRSALVPVANIGTTAGMWLFILGLLFGRSLLLMDIGIILFAAAVFFYVVTLPVEFNASSRAVQLLGESGVIAGDEEKPVRAVLNAAALTYVAAALVAIAYLLQFLLIRSERD